MRGAQKVRDEEIGRVEADANANAKCKWIWIGAQILLGSVVTNSTLQAYSLSSDQLYPPVSY